VPISIFFILDSHRIRDSSYGMSIGRKFGLGLRMLRNNLLIPSASDYKVHLAMALKILETEPEVVGDIIECGTWKGGSAANLSLVCRITGRKLILYDSFEGLPEPDPGDRQAKNYRKGDFAGSLEEVKQNIERYGAIESCEFNKGFFKDTLPRLKSPILLAFIDVDLEASLESCVKYIWPRLVDQGFIFIDESARTDYAALFFSERWWRENFDSPPGLIGAGTGLPLGDYFVGPLLEVERYPLQGASSGAYTRKSMSGYWSYYPTMTRAQPEPNDQLGSAN
jgi:hypothetical protein